MTFLDGGAGYKNALGYYLWVDDNGTKKILENDDVTNANGSLGNYNPTIIFPNGSLGIGGGVRSGGKLVPGHRRKLLGNQANGKFNNVNVGFFLVPNGWKGNNTGVGYDNKVILYSDKDFNDVLGWFMEYDIKIIDIYDIYNNPNKSSELVRIRSIN